MHSFDGIKEKAHYKIKFIFKVQILFPFLHLSLGWKPNSDALFLICSNAKLCVVKIDAQKTFLKWKFDIEINENYSVIIHKYFQPQTSK